MRRHSGPSVTPRSASAASATAIAAPRSIASGGASMPKGVAAIQTARPAKPSSGKRALEPAHPSRCGHLLRQQQRRSDLDPFPRLPGAVAQFGRQFREAAGANAPHEDDGERHEPGDDHERALQARPGRVDEEHRNRHQHEIEQRVQQRSSAPARSAGR